MSLKLAILASGNGSNFQAIIDSIQSKKLDATIQLLISDQPTAYALKRAEQHHIPSHVFTRKNFSDTLSFEKIIVKTLKQSEVDWVVLAGYMRILSPFFVQSFPQKILNIHPSLLPAFPGLNAIGQAFDYGCKVTGCTVHLVDEGCDTGAIIGQRSVVIEENDTLESLSQKIHVQEHELYPEVLQLISEERIQIKGRKILIQKKA